MSNFTDTVTKPKTGLIDLAVPALLLTALAIAIIYPEAYVQQGLMIGGRKILPLVAYLPLFAAGALYCIILRRKLLRPGLLDLSLIAYTGYLVLRNLGGPSAAVSIKYAVYSLGIFYLAALAVNAKRNRNAILWFLTALLAAISLYAVIEFLIQKNIIFGPLTEAFVPESQQGLHRARSSVGHPITFSAVLVQLLPFSILAWLGGYTRRMRVAAMLASLSGAVALLFTFTKGSWIAALLTGSAILIVSGRRMKRWLVPVSIVAGILAVSLAIFWQQMTVELLSKRSEQSFDVRLVAWEAALDGIQENWLIGVGLKQGQAELTEHIDPVWLELSNIAIPVDNYYLALLLEEGIVGFLLWMAAFGFILREGWLLRKKTPGDGWLIAGLASIAALSIAAFTFEALLAWPTFILFWFAAGILHGRRLMSERGTQVIRDV